MRKRLMDKKLAKSLLYLFLLTLPCILLTATPSHATALDLHVFRNVSTSGALTTNGNLSVGNRIIVSNDHTKYIGGSGTTGGVPTGTYVLGPLLEQRDITVLEPDIVQDMSDAIPMMTVDTYNYPNGITITAIRLATSANSTLAVNLEEWTEPDESGTETTIDNIATAAADEQTETTISDAAVAAGTYIMLDLDTTNVDWLHLTIWFYVNN